MLSGTSCALVPSGKAVWLRIEEWNMHWPKLHFFSGFLSTMLLTFLSFSLFLMQQTPRAIVVKCDGSVYDVDVELTRKVETAMVRKRPGPQNYNYLKAECQL